jgi:hypothetical protein
VQNANNFSPIVKRPVEDHISPEWQTAQPRSKLIASAANERISRQQLTMFLQPLDKLRRRGGIIARNKTDDFGEIALGVVAKPELGHGSAGLKALFQPRKNLFCLAHPPCRQIIEPGLQVALQRCQLFRFAFGWLDRDRKPRVCCWRFRELVEDALRKLGCGDLYRERLRSLCRF